MRFLIALLGGVFFSGGELCLANEARVGISISTFINANQRVVGAMGQYDLEEGVEAVALYIVDSRGDVFHRWCGHQQGEAGNWGELGNVASPCVLSLPREGRYWVHAKAWDAPLDALTPTNYAFRSTITEILLTSQELWRFLLPARP